MSARVETLLWLAQRITAAVLAVAVIVHIATIVMAMDGGLSAREIIGRIQGHAGWLAFYLVFVAAVAIHAPIGVRTILRELTAMSPVTVNALAVLFAALLAFAGSRAVLGLYGFAG